MSGPDIVWLLREVVEAIHDEQIAWHGGSEGIRDAGLLASAIDRPRNLAAYGDPDLASLAVSLGYGLARNHPFVDGNKRTAFVSVETFLLLNGAPAAQRCRRGRRVRADDGGPRRRGDQRGGVRQMDSTESSACPAMIVRSH